MATKAAAAAALAASLLSLRAALRGGSSEFPALALALAAALALQLAARLATAQRSHRLASLGELTRHWPAVALDGARMAAQSWLRATALVHFGLLFAFLVDGVGELLLPAVADCYHLARHSGGSNAAAWACALATAGYLVVAGVDAFEYGSLLQSAALIALSVAMKLLEQGRVSDGKLRAASLSCPFFAELSTAAAILLMAPASWLGQLTSRTEEVLKARANEAPAVSGGWWVVCVVMVAVWQRIALWLDTQQSAKSSDAALRTLTGLLCSLGLSIVDSQDGWIVRGFAVSIACFLIIFARKNQLQHHNTPQHMSDLDIDFGIANSDSRRTSVDNDEQFLDTYRAATSGSTSVVSRIVASLWARDDSRKILMFLSVNVSYMFVELAVGFWSNSLGLIGDAGHMLFDNSALVIGLVASYIGKLPADEQFTYGYGRVEVLSGFLNSMLLLLISFHLLAEAGSRFFDPPEVTTDHLLLTSVVGLLVNIVGLVWFHDHVHSHGHGSECGHGHSHGHAHSDTNAHSHGHSHSHSHGETEKNLVGSASSSNSNMYGVYLHVLADTLGSVGVIISSLLIQFKDWHIADPLSSAMIALLIFGSTLPLLKDTLLQLLQRVPKEKEHDIAAALREIQATVEGIEQVEKWHVWQHAQDMMVASLHLAVAPSAIEQDVMKQAREIFRRLANIDEFLTIQVRKRSDAMHLNPVSPHQASKAFVGFDSRHTSLSHEHHAHDHNHEHSHHHHEEAESVMSTHENPVSEDVRFGRWGQAAQPPPPPFQHQRRFEPHRFGSSVTSPAAHPLFQQKSLAWHSSNDAQNNQIPEMLLAQRSAMAQPAARRLHM